MLGITSIGPYTNPILEEVDIQFGVKEIKKNAFNGCEKLRKITIPSSVTKIEEGAFEGCSSLQEIELPLNLTEIAPHMFYECSSLKKVTGVKGKIGERAFYGCKSLKEIDLRNATVIEDYAFGYCKSLKEIDLRNVTIIEDSAYCGCSSLTFVNLKNTTKIENDAFFNCSKLKNIVFPFSLKTIEEGSFAQTDIEDIVIPGSVQTIGEDAFRCCQELKHLEIRSGVQCIEEGAFEFTESLEELILPDSVKVIGANAFRGSNILSLKLNEGLETIGENAFEGCRIDKVDLPKSLKSIHPDAFDKNTLITSSEILYEDFLKNKDLCDSIDKLYSSISSNDVAILQGKYQVDKTTLDIENAKKEIGIKETDKLSAYNAIEAYRNETKSTVFQAESNKLKNKELLVSYEDKLKELQEEENILKEQLHHTFFLAVSKKKVLSEQLDVKNNDIAILLNTINETESEIAQSQSVIDSVNTHIEELQQKYQKICTDLQAINAKIKELENKKQDAIKRINLSETTVKKDRESLQLLEEQLNTCLPIQKEKLKTRSLELEKNRLIEDIPVNNIDVIQVSDIVGHSEKIADKSMISELLNRYMTLLIQRKARQNLIELIQKFENQIQRIIEINNLLNLSEFDGIEMLKTDDSIQDEDWSENIIRTLSELLYENTAWDKLREKLEAKQFDSETSLPWDSFGIENVCVHCRRDKKKNYAGKTLAFLPFCILILDPNKRSEVQIMLYSDIKAELVFEEKVNKTQKTNWKPPIGYEVISKKYLYENSDGSPDKRYKKNPLTIVSRYAMLFIECDKTGYIIEDCDYKELKNLEKLFSAHLKFFSKKSTEEFNAALLEPNGRDLIDELIADKRYKQAIKEKKERERAIREQKEAEERKIAEQKEEEARRKAIIEMQKAAEELRIAEEKEKEARRKAIIENQKAINEARKMEEMLKKSKSDASKMFYDDTTQEESKDSQDSDNVKDASIFKVSNKQVITNNIFKIKLIQSADIDSNCVSAYFVDSFGNTISNVRNIDLLPIGEEYLVGFVLNSGIDFTQMKNCILRIDADGTNLTQINFDIKIAFFSDF